MGLVFAIALAGLVWAALWRSKRLSPAMLKLASAALLFGLGGYALQGRIGLVGSPAGLRVAPPLPPVMPIDLAGEFYGRFNAAYSWLVIANSYMTRGDSAEAVAALNSGLRARPTDSELWIALGNALITHGGGRMSPAAKLAFARAAQTAPRHPGPPFFLGLALLGQGQPVPALHLWKGVLASAPAEAKWRAKLEQRIALIERLSARPAPPGPADPL